MKEAEPLPPETPVGPGSRVGPYELEALIGSGGMGEVYRARDTRLGRLVTLKFLRASVSRDPVRLQRFEQEARAAGMLNHPNIVTIHDVGRHGETPYVVSELLEGETLRRRLSGAALPVGQAVEYAVQVAQGLAAAHEKGIVHRDLKPENLCLTRDGRLKILDFGIAKLIEPEPLDQEATTATGPRLTDTGMVVGTAGYMSPEQVRGLPVDHRSDIFSFGAVVYEMLSGTRAFQGPSAVETMNAIVKEEPPPLTATNPRVPTGLEKVVRRCLEKNPESRFHSAHDLAYALEAGTVSGAERLLPAVAARFGRPALPWIVVGILAAFGMGASLWSIFRARTPAPRPLARFALTLSPTEPLALEPLLSSPVAALSPDGTRLVYVARHGSSSQLYLRPMDQLEASPVPETEGASGPFFSPDGRWVGYFAEGKLKKVALDGGAPLNLCDAAAAGGGAWAPGGTIVFAAGPGTGLWRVPAAGGEARPLTTLDPGRGERAHRWPELLPGGRAVLFNIWAGGRFDDNARIAVVSLETGERRALLEGGANPRYSTSGHLVFGRRGALLAVPFDAARLQVTGSPVSVVEGVVTDPWTGAAHFSVSRNGTLAYVPGRAGAPDRTLVWVDRGGGAHPLPEPSRGYMHPRLSPDGQRVAVAVEGARTDVWTYDLSRGALTRATSEGTSISPVWAPDGSRLAFTSSQGAALNLFWRPADGGGVAERLTTSGLDQFPSSWSPDGQALVFTQVDPSTGLDIWLLPLAGDRTQRPLVQTPFNEGAAAYSPDGKYLAYQSDESGRPEIYVLALSSSGGRWRISTEGGMDPLWARSGRELFYRSGERLVAVTVQTSPVFTVGKARPLFEGSYDRSNLPSYDVAPDGQRFLMIKAGKPEPPPTRVNVVLEWFEELKRRVPSGQ